MRNVMASMAVIVSLVCAQTTLAGWDFGIRAGDMVNVTSQGQPAGGGPFALQKVGSSSSFWTFCLEKGETLGVNPHYVQAVSDSSVYGGVGPGGDLVKAGTKLIFSNYIKGGAQSGGAGWASFWNAATGSVWSNSVPQNDIVQHAIWNLELEPNPSGNPLAVALAAYAAANTAGADLSDIKVLNLLQNLNGVWERAQDVLTIVPEPASLAGWLGIASVFGMGFYVRRRRSK